MTARAISGHLQYLGSILQGKKWKVEGSDKRDDGGKQEHMD